MNKMQTYGLPLDSRGNYCKNDWQMWVMGFADNKSHRTTLINTLWKYINETTSRVPVCDNHDVKSGKQAMFQAEVSLEVIGCVSLLNNSLRADTLALAACQTQHSLRTISTTTIGTICMDAKQKSHLLLAYTSRMVRKHLLNNV